MYNYLYNIILKKSLRIIILNLFIRTLICIVLLNTIEAFKTKILAWTPETQYASLIPIIIINEIFGLRIFELKGRLRYGWSITYAGICIILYTVFLNTIIIKNYKNWLAYQEISYKLTSYINIICVMIFIILGIMNTKVSI